MSDVWVWMALVLGLVGCWIFDRWCDHKEIMARKCKCDEKELQA